MCGRKFSTMEKIVFTNCIIHKSESVLKEILNSDKSSCMQVAKKTWMGSDWHGTLTWYALDIFRPFRSVLIFWHIWNNHETDEDERDSMLWPPIIDRNLYRLQREIEAKPRNLFISYHILCRIISYHTLYRIFTSFFTSYEMISSLVSIGPAQGPGVRTTDLQLISSPGSFVCFHFTYNAWMMNKIILTHEMLQDTYICDHLDPAPFWLQLNHFTPIPNLNAINVTIFISNTSTLTPSLLASPSTAASALSARITPASGSTTPVTCYLLDYHFDYDERDESLAGWLIDSGDDWLIDLLTITDSSKVRYGKLSLNCSPWWTECSTFS